MHADQAFKRLENDYDARLGVWALHTATKRTVAWRAAERFAYASTFKVLACAAALQQDSADQLDDVIAYTKADLVSHSPITKQHVKSGMTILEICDAAIRYSDNTAGNLLFRELGGPAGLNRSLHAIGDHTTHANRVEPDLNGHAPSAGTGTQGATQGQPEDDGREGVGYSPGCSPNRRAGRSVDRPGR